jgi:hypothetical protein
MFVHNQYLVQRALLCYVVLQLCNSTTMNLYVKEEHRYSTRTLGIREITWSWQLRHHHRLPEAQ